MSDTAYVHGYSDRESVRLSDQATTLSALLHHDTRYPPGSRVLECGCGTGAQTVLLAASSPAARIVSVDLSPASLLQARSQCAGAGHRQVEFLAADAFQLPFEDRTFDHVFVCFLLEHLAEPVSEMS